MNASVKILLFLQNTYHTILYFLIMAVKENFRNYIRQAGAGIEPKDAVLVLGNGPSMKVDLDRIIARKEHQEKDVMAVNYFAMDPRFEQIRPAFYTLSDPTFFRKTFDWDRAMKLYATLNEKVSWPMTLYVQYYNPEGFDYRKVLPNKNIRIVRFHSQVYHGFRAVEFWLFRHGLGSANFGTVVQNCAYIALNLGYKTVEMYGVDHTLLQGLCVDSENRLCREVTYFYDQEAPSPKPIYQNLPHKPYTMASYLKELSELFRGHEVLNAYAHSLDARIINRTRNSMIDAYERRPLD